MMLEMTLEQFKKAVGGKNKFGAIKTTCGHKHVHDSKKEAARCDQLCLLERSGAISRLKQQHRFVLQKGFWSKHTKILPISYIADFTYYEKGEWIIEDVKGKRTEVYLLKKKMLLNKIKNKTLWRFIET